MRDDNDDRSPKLTYTIFPKDWDGKKIYDFLVARAEATEDTKNIIEGKSNSGKDRSTDG